ncbi:MAG: type I DNA topoisomerase, partial [Clostridia bacterium]|nr:type I DNA topoisomerase [Clostridia bacterium]
MPKLVIVESPTKVTPINSYLGDEFKVIASKGHVRDLPKSSLGVDVDNNFKVKYINIQGKSELINQIKKEAKAADTVYLATDPDREGEAIAWHLATVLGIEPEKAHRVSFNEITKNTVCTEIENSRAINMNLVNSQQARRVLDRIVGYKLSPYLWKTVKSGLSAGRMQSVATRIIVERDAEIAAFEPKEYWTVEALLKGSGARKIKAKFHGTKNGKLELTCEAEAQKVLDACESEKFTVASVARAKKSKSPMPPFITSTMQQDAFRKLNFQTKKTMKVAQEL